MSTSMQPSAPTMASFANRLDVMDETSLFLGLSTYFVILSAYLSMVVPFSLIDHFNLLPSYRIQPGKSPSKDAYWKAAEMVCVNFLFLFPTTLVGGAFLKEIFAPIDAEIDWIWLPLRILAYFIIDDACFYAYHRFLHAYPGLYRRFHKPHHYFTVPFAAMSYATHPVELLLQSFGGSLGPMLAGVPIVEFWIWLVVRQWQGVEDHTGYELPWSPTHWLPFVGGSEFHDLVSNVDF